MKLSHPSIGLLLALAPPFFDVCIHPSKDISIYPSVSLSFAISSMNKESPPRYEDDARPTRKCDGDGKGSARTVFFTSNDVLHPVEGVSCWIVPVCRHYVFSLGASYTGYVREYVAPSSPPALAKPPHLHVPLPSQTEGDTPVVVHPLLRRN
ncbi:hypothetical protein EV421DRAFT_1130256 [Armillaria borealis]|uniref:Uncharacterized protein n=1 Tax=Armillaria borealis TaxID=47425 RepID=A0AA39MJP8_9AGAR|nr:hypothetical protein EV421DRAFT_1130256 [Armillaria borealis]